MTGPVYALNLFNVADRAEYAFPVTVKLADLSGSRVCCGFGDRAVVDG
jgi:hypothetical protein